MIYHLLVGFSGVLLLLLLWVGVQALAPGSLEPGAKDEDGCREETTACGSCPRWSTCDLVGK